MPTRNSCRGGRAPGCCQILNAAMPANTRKTKPMTSCHSEWIGFTAAGITCLKNRPDCLAEGAHCFADCDAILPDCFATGNHFFANLPAARANCSWVLT